MPTGTPEETQRGMRERSRRRAAALRLKYGLAPEEFEKKLEQQQSRCPICTVLLAADRPVVDHDHVTGVIRDILCNRCNVVLGHCRDDVSLLQALIAYLGRHASAVGTAVSGSAIAAINKALLSEVDERVAFLVAEKARAVEEARMSEWKRNERRERVESAGDVARKVAMMLGGPRDAPVHVRRVAVGLKIVRGQWREDDILSGSTPTGTVDQIDEDEYMVLVSWEDGTMTMASLGTFWGKYRLKEPT